MQISDTIKKNKKVQVAKVPTGIEGFDDIAHGGIPKGRTTLVSGTSGSGKTVFAMEFLIGGILQNNDPGVFVTFEETPEDITKNMSSFGWPLKQLIKDKKLLFVDASPVEDESVEIGDYDLSGFISRVLNAVKKVNAKRVSVDSISALFSRFRDQVVIRHELYRLGSQLKRVGVTTILTAERILEKDGQIGRFGVEEFVSDNVILLHNYLDTIRGDRKRSVEILKFRGTTHETQDTPLLVLEDGMHVFPRPRPTYKGHMSSDEKIASGIPGLNKMLFGGIYKNSTNLVTGASGTGKTVSAMAFIMEGVRQKEKGIYIAFEESAEQLYRNAESFGWDLRGEVKKGNIRLFTSVPEELKAEEHFKRFRDIVEEVDVDRFVIDSLSALERIYPPDRFREFTIGLNAYLKGKKVTTMLTNTTTALLDVSQITETHLSTATDNIILLKYIELDGHMKRAIALIKARGSDHDKQVRELIIDSHGMSIGHPFYGVENLMAGSAKRVTKIPESVARTSREIDRLRSEYVDGKMGKDEYEKELAKLRVDQKGAEKEWTNNI